MIILTIGSLFAIFLSVDATFQRRLGKFINDSPPQYANCKMVAIHVDGKIHLCLFARGGVIEPGTEIRYSYGEIGLPWRKV